MGRPVRAVATVLVNAVRVIGPAAKAAVSALIAVLKVRDPEVRMNASSALGSIGTDAKAAEKPLVEHLKDEDEGVRGQAAESLGKIGADPKVAVPALAAALADKHPGVRGDVCHALAHFKAAAKPAVPALMKLFKDADHGVRVHAAEAVYEIDGAIKPVLPILIEGLKHEDPFVRGDAAHTLGEIGPPAKEAAPSLRAMQNAGIRVHAAEAHVKVDKTAVKDALSVLIEGLKNEENRSGLKRRRHSADWGRPRRAPFRHLRHCSRIATRTCGTAPAKRSNRSKSRNDAGTLGIRQPALEQLHLGGSPSASIRCPEHDQIEHGSRKRILAGARFDQAVKVISVSTLPKSAK